MHYYSIALFVVINYANYRFYRYIEYKLDLYILLANTLSIKSNEFIYQFSINNFI